MPATTLMPMPRLFFSDSLSAGKPLAGGRIYTFQSGTSTPQATYTDSTGTVPNPNPVILDAAGGASIWLVSGQAYRIVAQNSAGVQEWAVDNVSGLSTVTSAVNQAITPVSFSATPTFTATGQYQVFQITLTGNVTSSILNMTGVTAPSIVSFEISQDSTGGRTFVWPVNVVGGSLVNPSANQVTTQSFLWDGTTAWPWNYPPAVAIPTTFSATPTFTAGSQYQVFKMTLTGNVTSSTLNMAGVNWPAIVTFELVQDATGGRTFAWPANVIGTFPVNSAANSTTTQTFFWDGTNAYPFAYPLTQSTAVAFSATPTFTAVSQNQLFSMTLTGNVTSSTLTMTGIAAPSLLTFELTQDGTGGRTFAWPANVIGAVAPTLSANAITTQHFVWDGTNARAAGPGMTSGTSVNTGVISQSVSAPVVVSGAGGNLAVNATNAVTSGAGGNVTITAGNSAGGSIVGGGITLNVGGSTGAAPPAQLSSNASFGTYKNLATYGEFGLPALVAGVDVTGQNAAIGTTTLFSPVYSILFQDQYLLTWSAKVTTAAGTSSTLGALTIVYTDPDGVVQTITAPATVSAGTIATTSTGNSTTTVLIGMPLHLNAKSGTNITYAFAYASNPASAMLYNLHIRLAGM